MNPTPKIRIHPEMTPKQINTPCCTHCIHSRRTRPDFKKIVCKRFGWFDVVTGEKFYDTVETARTNPVACGLDGKFFEPIISPCPLDINENTVDDR